MLLSKMKISVIIPTYNEERHILSTHQQVTAYLARQDYSWSVLVADDGSNDGTAELVRQLARDESRFSPLSFDHRGREVPV